MVTASAVSAFSPLRTLLGLRSSLQCRAGANRLSSRFLPIVSHPSSGYKPAASVSSLRADLNDRYKRHPSTFASPASPLLLRKASDDTHPRFLNMRDITSSNRERQPLIPAAGPSNPGGSSGGDPEADGRTSDPASAPSEPALNPDELRRQKLRDNMFKDGELGKRGEEYVVIQMLLFLGIAFPPNFLFSSFLPLTFVEPSDVWYLNYVIGAALLATGVFFSAKSAKDLGTNLSPFPKPPTDSELETGGMYAVVRHPIYANALVLASGLTLLTCSTGRGILTVLLLLLFDRKAAVEEGFLVDKFGRQYEEYREKVKKLIPYLY